MKPEQSTPMYFKARPHMLGAINGTQNTFVQGINPLSILFWYLNEIWNTNDTHSWVFLLVFFPKIIC